MFNDNGSFLLALFEFFLFFAWFMCLFWVFGDIFRSKDLGGGAKTLWVLFVIFVPWLGHPGVPDRARRRHGGAGTGAGQADAAGAGRVHQVRGRQPRPGRQQIRSRRPRPCSTQGAITQAEFDALKAKALAT